MITRIWQPNPFDPGSRVTSRHEWSGQTARELTPDAAHALEGVLRVWRNGSEVSGADLERTLSPDDTLAYRVEPRTEAIVAGLGYLGVNKAIAYVAALVIQAVAAKFLIKALVGSPDKPPEQDDRNSTHYGFGGIQSNASYEGAPIPVVMGEPRVGGNLINIYTQSVPAPNTTQLFMLFLMADHEVEAIGGVTADADGLSVETGDLPEGLQINGQPASNFYDVECSVRLGTYDQTPIPGLASSRLQFLVQQTLNEPTDTTAFPTASGVYATGASEMADWDTAISYTMGDDADEFTAQLYFPQGLFSINGNGQYVPTGVTVQVRYIEVDGGGTPVGDYVVLPAWPEIRGAVSTPFYWERSQRFLDPNDYTAPVQSRYLELNGTSDYADVLAPTFTGMSPEDTEFSFTGWARLPWDHALPDDEWSFAQSGASVVLLDQFDEANDEGFEVSLSLGNDATWSNGIRHEKAALQFKVGDGTTETVYSTGQRSGIGAAFLPGDLAQIGSGIEGSWAHVAATYKANTDSATGAGRIRLYLNGSQIRTFSTPSSFRPVWDESESIYFGCRDGSTFFLEGAIEEFTLHQREISAVEVFGYYGGGTAQPGTSAPPGIIAGWHMDNSADDFVGSNDLVLRSTASYSSAPGDGPVTTAANGTPKKSSYRIDVQRTTTAASAQFSQDAAEWNSIVLTEYDEFSYPGQALMAIRVRASQQLNTNRPLVTVPVKGYKALVWDGVDANFPQFTRRWTRNNAELAASIALDEEIGGGEFFQEEDIDWAGAKALADRCDEAVWDLSERPFTSTIFLDPSASLTVPANWPTGMVEVPIPEADFRVGWPATFGNKDVAGEVTPTEDATIWIKLENIPGSAHAEIQALEGVSLAVGALAYIKAAPARYSFFCHAPSDPTGSRSYSASSDVTAELQEARFEFDGVFDRANFSLWEAMIQVLEPARARPLLAGSLLRFFSDEPRSVSHMATMANLVEGGYKGSTQGADGQFNHEEIRYLDRARNYEETFEELTHPTLRDPTRFEAYRSRSIQLFGVSRRSQVRRHLIQDLETYHLLRRTLEIPQNVDAIAYEPGDRVAVSHDVPGWGTSGRLLHDSMSATVVFLDRPVTFQSNASYQLQMRESVTDTIETVAIDEDATGTANGVPTASTYPAGSRIVLESALSFFPKAGDVYVFGEVSKGARDFQVVGTRLNPSSLERVVTLLEYNAAVYDAEWTEELGDPQTSLPPPSPDEIPEPAESLRVGEDSIYHDDGTAELGLRVEWQYPTLTERKATSTAIWLSETDDAYPRQVGEVGANAQTFRIPGSELERGKEYRVHLQAKARNGTSHPLEVCPCFDVTVHGFAPIKAAPSNVTASVSGERVILEWDAESVAWARAVEVRAGGWILGQPIANVPASAGRIVSEAFIGTTETDFGAQGATYYLRAVDGLGRWSEAAEIVVNLTPKNANVALETQREDTSTDWTGTLSSLKKSTSKGPKQSQVGQPPQQRGNTEVLFLGSTASGSYSFTNTNLGAAGDVYVQAFVAADQIHPLTWEDATFTWDSLAAQRWTWEGPLWTTVGEVENATLEIQMDYDSGTSVSGTPEKFSPGLYRNLRSSEFSVAVTRPNERYDIRLRRMAVRMTDKL